MEEAASENIESDADGDKRKLPRKRICGAKAKGTGKPCKGYPLANGRCRLHGGLVPRGPLSPNFKHGGRSKYMPRGFAAKYQEALDDPEFLKARQNLAAVEARLRELFSQLDAKASAMLWEDMGEAVDAMVSAANDGNADKLKEAMQTVVSLRQRGAKEHHIWREITEQIDRQTKIEGHYLGVLEKQQQFMTNEQAMALLTAVLESVKRHVSDGSILGRISEDFGRLMGHGVPKAIGHTIDVEPIT